MVTAAVAAAAMDLVLAIVREWISTLELAREAAGHELEIGGALKKRKKDKFSKELGGRIEDLGFQPGESDGAASSEYGRRSR